MQSPTKKKLVAPSASAAIGVDVVTIIGVAPYDGTISAAKYISNSAITGANTNSRTLGVINKGAAGSGALAPASLAMTSGVNTVGFVPKALTLSGTASDLAVVKGDVIVGTSTHVGTGIADPGGVWSIEITRTTT